MTRKKMRNNLRELSRRIHLEQHGSLKGWGKIARFYGDQWRPNWEEAGRWGFKSYSDMWNSKVMTDMRESVGM